MAEIWGAAIAAVAAAGTAAYSANQQKKNAAQHNASLAGAQDVQYEKLPFPELVDWKKSQAAALGQNEKMLPDIFGFGNQVNALNLGQSERGYTRMQPYFKALQEQIGRNALSFARGELPSDVVSSIGRASATRGLASGFGMGASGAGVGTSLGSLNLRALGLTSLDLSRQGTDLGMRVNQQAQSLAPALFDIGSQFVSPNAAIGVDSQNANTINDWNRANAGIVNKGIGENTSLANTILQMQAETQLSANQSATNMYASASPSVQGLLQALLRQQNNGGNFYSGVGSSLNGVTNSAMSTYGYGASKGLT